MLIDTKLVLIAFFITIFCVGIIIILRLTMMKDPIYPIIKGWSLPTFKTGDLLFVSYQSMRGKLVKVFTGSKWTHMGMVYIPSNSNKQYVIEAAYYDKKNHGILKTPLQEWLSWNSKRVLGWLSKTGPEIPDHKIEKVLNSISNADSDMFVVSWLKAVVTRKYQEDTNKKAFYCSELVAYLCQELGIIRKELMPSSYSPKVFIERNIPFINGNGYLEPKILSSS